ncbi:S9 family peptidase [Catenovulum sp. 2E275]|uniref:alpha/beta hydrolase family protein n=1 Tax=Catenovulum sp. 2E275 TaxID=2980497 RepID=UPI0021D2E4F8|nr:S9 family peptidase [Catenovulum sp. 2E275]MCU4674122.1 S9 family peptidase [Catenovulum sp. 2E275]
MKKTWIYLLFILAIPLNGFAKITHIPTEAFATKPDISSIRISPDGKQAIMLAKINQKKAKGTAIKYIDLVSMGTFNLAFAEDKDFIISDIEWANNDDLLVEVLYNDTLGALRLKKTRLLKFNIFEKKFKPVLSLHYMENLSYISNIMSTVVDYLPNDPDHILMSLSGVSTSAEYYLPSVVKVSIHGKNYNKVIQPAMNDVTRWITDQQHNVRIAIAREKTQYKILERNNENQDFRTLWTFSAFDEAEIWPLGFDDKPNILYVSANKDGRRAVFTVDLNDPKLELKHVFSSSKYDVSTYLVRAQSTKKVIGVGDYIWDKDRKKLIKQINQVLPDTENDIIEISRDDNIYFVLSTSSTEPGVYFMGNRKTNKIAFFGTRYAELAPENLAQRQKIHYQARDGLKIEGFLTLPKSDKQNKLPTIILPHGGPISNDTDGFDYWAQFFANRGYVVVQMNFRGSYGYGLEFLQHGLKGWGQAMQDDIEDATNWAIKQGYADPKRICIVGASYGGYAALMGAIKTPDLYQCAISFAGVSDLEELVDASKFFSSHEIVKKMIGEDSDFLANYSPINQAEKINIPVLLIHGTQDKRVLPEQSQEMYKVMKARKKDVQYIELEGANHHLSNSEDRLTTFKAMEKFLKSHL